MATFTQSISRLPIRLTPDDRAEIHANIMLITRSQLVRNTPPASRIIPYDRDRSTIIELPALIEHDVYEPSDIRVSYVASGHPSAWIDKDGRIAEDEKVGRTVVLLPEKRAITGWKKPQPISLHLTVPAWTKPSFEFVSNSETIIFCRVEGCDCSFTATSIVALNVTFLCKEHGRKEQIAAAGRIFNANKDYADHHIHFQTGAFDRDMKRAKQTATLWNEKRDYLRLHDNLLRIASASRAEFEGDICEDAALIEERASLIGEEENTSIEQDLDNPETAQGAYGAADVDESVFGGGFTIETKTSATVDHEASGFNEELATIVTVCKGMPKDEILDFIDSSTVKRLSALMQNIPIAQYERDHGLEPDSLGRASRRKKMEISKMANNICDEGLCRYLNGEVHDELTHYLLGMSEQEYMTFTRLGGVYMFYTSRRQKHQLVWLAANGDDEGVKRALLDERVRLLATAMKNDRSKALKARAETLERINQIWDDATLCEWDPNPEYQSIELNIPTSISSVR